MDKTAAEIAASKIELWTSCSWRRFHFAGPRGGSFAEPIKQHPDNHPDIWFAGGEETGHRMAACWNACAGMVDPETEVAAARAEGFRAGAEAALACITEHRKDGGLSIEEAAILNVLESSIRSLPILETDHG